MRQVLTGLAILAVAASLGACNRQERAADADTTADANADVMVEENSAMPADDNAMVANEAPAAAVAEEPVTEQGSTDHGSTDH